MDNFTSASPQVTVPKDSSQDIESQNTPKSRLIQIISGGKRKYSLLGQKFLEKVKPLALRVLHKVQAWLQKFKISSREERVRMIRTPVIIGVIFLFIILYGHYFLPPRIVVTFPGEGGERIPLDSTIEVQFDRGMNKGSVEKSFSISPSISGKFEWLGDAKFVYKPNEPFSIAQKYAVKLGSFNLSSFFIPKLKTHTFVFETLGHPVVLLASPQTEAPEANNPITVMFDRPMIPLTTLDEKERQLPAFTITPEIKGEGRWLGTTAYQFRPSEPLKNATTYTYRVPAGIKAKDNGELQEDAVFSFSTQRPRVLATTPTVNYNFASPTASVSATLNLPINVKSASESFHLFKVEGVSKEEVPVNVRVDKQQVGIYSIKPLQREIWYEAQIDAGLLSTEGENGLESTYSWRFKTAPLPKIISTEPKDASENVDEQHRIVIHFVSPMSEKSFKDNVSISPTPERNPSTYFSSYRDEHTLSIGTYLNRSTNFTITISGNVRDQYGVPLGKDYTFSFKTAPFKPSISIVPSDTYFASFNQEIVPRIVVKVVNVNEVIYKLYKLTRADFLNLHRIHYTSNDNQERNFQKYDPSKHELVREWKEVFDADKDVPVHVITKVEKGSDEKIPSGFYFLDASIGGGRHDNLVMVISRTSLTLKTSPNQAFVWAVDQISGEVVKDLEIELSRLSGNVVKKGKTNQDGVFMTDYEVRSPRNTYADTSNPLFAFARKDGDEAVVIDIWQGGIRPYEFGLESYYDPQESDFYQAKEQLKIHIVLDRPIYRPGQTVYYKGVVRRDNDGVYTLLDEKDQVQISVTDAQGRSVISENSKLSSYGTFSGSFTLSPEGSVGYYKISANILGNGFSQQFQVEEYRKPDFSVEVTTDKSAYADGETVKAFIDSKFFFGSPVDHAPVKWTLTTQDDPFRWHKDVRFEFGDADSYWYRPWWSYQDYFYYSGEKVADGTGTTDKDGHFEVKIPVNISDKNTNQRMRLEAIVTDVSNQAIANSKDFAIHQAGLHVGLKPERYSGRSGQESRVEIVSVGIAGDELPNIPVKVSFYKRTWDYVREEDKETGEFYWVNKSIDIFVTSLDVVTGEFGRAIASFVPPEGGSFRAVAEASDDKGRVTKSATYLWVSGSGVDVPQENHDRVVLVPDKQEYKIGEEANVVAPLPYEQMTALVTVERGSVFDYKVVKITPENQSFSVPIKERYSPNAFIAGVFVKAGVEVKDPPQFKMGISEIRVDNPKTKVTLDLSPNKERFSPGEEMKVNLTTKDGNGVNVKTEVAVALVDEAVWSLARANLADIHKTFYRPRNLSVLTANDLTISMDRINANVNLGAKGGSGGGGGEGGPETTREKFLDTAYWNAHIETDDNGRAEFSVNLPDNLTTWRLVGIAVSRETGVGDAVKKVLVTKDVLIQPLLPRFLSVGDKPKLGMVVHNNTASSSSVIVEISLEGIKVLDDKRKTLNIPANSSQNIYWETEVENSSEAMVLLKAEGSSGFSDAVKIKLPVISYFTPEVVATSGEAKDVAEEKIYLPKDIVPDLGSLDISLSATLGSGVEDAANYLLSFPYYCNEQVINRVVPAVHLLTLAKETGLDRVGGYEKKSLEGIVSDGIQRLTNTQRPDGGWGWCVSYESNTYLTAMVMDGLLDVKKQGFSVSDSVIERASGYLKQKLSSGKESLETQAYLAAIISRAQKVDSGVLSFLMDRRWQMNELGRAHLLRALQSVGVSKKDQFRLMDEMISLVEKTNTTAHWELKKREWYMMSSDTTLTSVMLEAIVAQNPRHTLIPDITRWLMQARYDGHWQTTRETSSAVRAIVIMQQARREGKPKYGWQILVNNILRKEGKFESQDLFKQITEDISLDTLVKEKDIPVKIQKSGKGALYYNMNLRYFLPFEEVEPQDAGIVVIREFIDRNGKVFEKETLEAGGELWVRLIILTPATTHHVIVEDKLPAGVEAVNESLATTSLLNVERLKIPKDRSPLYFRHNEIRDDRVVLFAETLPTGVYEYTYRVRPTTPGRYHHPPAQAYNMYIPDISGHSSGGWMEVVE